jgi:hypothetical protein
MATDICSVPYDNACWRRIQALALVADPRFIVVFVEEEDRSFLVSVIWGGGEGWIFNVFFSCKTPGMYYGCLGNLCCESK